MSSCFLVMLRVMILTRRARDLRGSGAWWWYCKDKREDLEVDGGDSSSMTRRVVGREKLASWKPRGKC